MAEREINDRASFFSIFFRSPYMKSRTNKGTCRREEEHSLDPWVCRLPAEKHVHQT